MVQINKCSSEPYEIAMEIIAHAYTFSEFMYVETSRDMKIRHTTIAFEYLIAVEIDAGYWFQLHFQTTTGVFSFDLLFNSFYFM